MDNAMIAFCIVRFLAIWSPLRCQFKITKKKARVIIGIIWIWAGTLALPWLLFFDLTNADEGRPSLVFCVENWPRGMSGSAYFVLVNLVLFYLLPLGIISLCYYFIWLRVWRRQVPDDSAVSRVELMHQRAKVSVLKMLIFVVASFTISWLPLYAIFIRLKLGPHVMEGSIEESVLDLALPIAQWLGASNSCVNPMLYAFLNVKFRQALVALFRGHKWTRQPTLHFQKPKLQTLRQHLQQQANASTGKSSDCDITTA